MKKYLILIVLFITNSVLSQIKFIAEASKNSIQLNERIGIEFTMNVDGDNFEAPNFEASGFRIVGGQSQAVSQNWVNGKGTIQKTYSYFLMPLKKGNLTIKSASIEFNGKIYKSNPITIQVTDAVNVPSPRTTSTNNQSVKDVFLVAEVSNSNPYLNEAITITYKLYFGYNISLFQDPNEINSPKFNNFWSQNSDVKNIQAIEEVYNGQRIRSAVLRKTILYPQKTGKLVIDPLIYDLEFGVATGRTDFFGDMITINQSKRISTGTKNINVKPLPESGKPADFTGAVGTFDFTVTPSKTSLKSGESLDLNLNVSGDGNLKLFDLPKPEIPSEIEAYDPIHSENISTQSNGMSGSISDKITIIPQQKGIFTLKPIRFSFFDIRTKTYRTITSSEIKLDVIEGNNNIVSSNPQKNNSNKSFKKTFVFVKQKTVLTPIEKDDFLGSGMFYLLFSIPFLSIPALILFKRKKESQKIDVVGNKIKKSNSLAKQYLSDAKSQLDNKEKFYVAIEKALHNFLKAKLNIETSEMSKEKIKEILISKNANLETISEFIKLSENCEFARYAPSTTSVINQDYDKAIEVITELEKQMK